MNIFNYQLKPLIRSDFLIEKYLSQKAGTSVIPSVALIFNILCAFLSLWPFWA